MIQRIVYTLLTTIFIFTSTVHITGEARGVLIENRPGGSDTAAQTIKITRDMRGWIGTHFDPNVRGEFLSISEIESQKGRFFLEILSSNGKVLRRRVMRSASEAKAILKEINDGALLINYIDKIIYGDRGGTNKPGAYNT